MFCRKCGKEIVDDSEWCMYCGEKVYTTKQNKECINNPNSETLHTKHDLEENDLSKLNNKNYDQQNATINKNKVNTVNKIINSNIDNAIKESKKELKNSYLIGGFCTNLSIIGFFRIVMNSYPNNIFVIICNFIFTFSVIIYLLYIFPCKVCKENKFVINNFNQNILNKISFSNGLFGGVWGFLLNSNCKKGIRGYSCFIIGTLNIIAWIFVSIIIFS